MNHKIVSCFKHYPDRVFLLNFPTLFKTLLEFHFSCIGAMGLLGQTQAATEWFMLIVWATFFLSHPILCSTTGIPIARGEGCLELVHVCGQSSDALLQSQDHEKGCPGELSTSLIWSCHTFLLTLKALERRRTMYTFTLRRSLAKIQGWFIICTLMTALFTGLPRVTAVCPFKLVILFPSFSSSQFCPKFTFD